MSIRMTIGVLGMPYPEDVNDLSQLAWTQLRCRLSEAARLLANCEEYLETGDTTQTRTVADPEIERLNRKVDDLERQVLTLYSMINSLTVGRGPDPYKEYPWGPKPWVPPYHWDHIGTPYCGTNYTQQEK